MNLGRNCRKKCGDLSFQQSPGKSPFSWDDRDIDHKKYTGIVYCHVRISCRKLLYKIVQDALTPENKQISKFISPSKLFIASISISRKKTGGEVRYKDMQQKRHVLSFIIYSPSS